MPETRDAIARIIDARCFEYEAQSDRAKYIQETDQKVALKKADAILALLEPGWRASPDAYNDFANTLIDAANDFILTREDIDEAFARLIGSHTHGGG